MWKNRKTIQKGGGDIFPLLKWKYNFQSFQKYIFSKNPKIKSSVLYSNMAATIDVYT